MVLRKQQSQSTLEYVIILAVVVGAMLAAGVILRPNLENAYNAASSD
ncbi:MAG: hypothetical protein PHS66_06705 [Candidatus Omnitrophica bacterium]|nr:hypothetical protein [Candidatus Omnitrophota bacterium]